MVDRRVRLKEESYILYDWLCLNGSSKSVPVNIDKYCAWAEEHTGEKLTPQQLKEAIKELEAHDLIKVEQELLVLTPKEMDTNKIDPGF